MDTTVMSLVSETYGHFGHVLNHIGPIITDTTVMSVLFRN